MRGSMELSRVSRSASQESESATGHLSEPILNHLIPNDCAHISKARQEPQNCPAESNPNYWATKLWIKWWVSLATNFWEWFITKQQITGILPFFFFNLLSKWGVVMVGGEREWERERERKLSHVYYIALSSDFEHTEKCLILCLRALKNKGKLDNSKTWIFHLKRIP